METQGHTHLITMKPLIYTAAWVVGHIKRAACTEPMPANAVCTRHNAIFLLCFGMGTRSLYGHKHRFLALQVCVAQP